MEKETAFRHCLVRYYVDGELRDLVLHDVGKASDACLEVEVSGIQENFDWKWSVQLIPRREVTLHSVRLHLHQDYSDVRRVFANGFQSWSSSREYEPGEKIKSARAIGTWFSGHYGDDIIRKQLGIGEELYGWNYTYLKARDRRYYFYGSLTEETGHTAFVHRPADDQVQVIKDLVGKVIHEDFQALEVLHAFTYEHAAFQAYYKSLGLPPVQAEPAMGWTSWYYYYTGITEEIIRANLSAFREKAIPIKIFQIDDGYQRKVGDWLHQNKKFPGGMQALAGEIKSQGLKAGLWLAPFICERKSDLFHEHPDWLLRREDGKLLKVGYNPLWSGWYYALNIYHDEVREYLKKVFDTVLVKWGYDLVKLDFLFAASCIPHNGKSRGEIMRDAMLLLREWVGEKEILGCGVPLMQSAGLVEYCRIGPDIHLTWDFPLLKWLRIRERPSNYNAVGNIINRRQLGKRAFVNDPDVFILRQARNKLSQDEKFTLLLTNLIFGQLIFTSDNIAEYDEETFELYRSTFPQKKCQDIKVEQQDDLYRVRFRVKDHYYTALINNSRIDRQLRLAPGWYYENRSKTLVEGGQYMPLRKRESRLFFEIPDTTFALAGTIGHLFCGAEVQGISLENDELHVEADTSLYETTVFVKVPHEYEIKSANGQVPKRVIKKDYDIIQVEIGLSGDTP